MIDENGEYRYHIFKIIHNNKTEDGLQSCKVAGFGEHTIIEERDGETWVIDPVKNQEYVVKISKDELEKSIKDFPDSFHIDGHGPKKEDA